MKRLLFALFFLGSLDINSHEFNPAHLVIKQLSDDELFSYFLREISNDSEKKSKFESFILKAKDLDPEEFDVSQANYDKKIGMLLDALRATDGNNMEFQRR